LNGEDLGEDAKEGEELKEEVGGEEGVLLRVVSGREETALMSPQISRERELEEKRPTLKAHLGIFAARSIRTR